MKPIHLIPFFLALFSISGLAQPPKIPAEFASFGVPLCIQLAPQNLKAGDQAVLVIVMHYQKGVSKPVELKNPLNTTVICADQLVRDESFSSAENPDALIVLVYRITLKSDSYTFAASDFSNLPPGFRLSKIKVYREKL